jgi:AraC-like DNA-binding protein
VKELTVFPNQDKFHYTFYTDSATGGNSEIISHVVTDRKIQIDFELKNGFTSPYIGLIILPHPDPLIQLACYNQIAIKVRGGNLNNLGIALFTTNPYPENVKQNPEISFYTTFNISSTIQTYSLNLDQFKVPDWWMEMNNISDAASKKPDLRTILHLNINNGYTPNVGQKQSIEIYSITFSRNNKPLLIHLLLLELGVILLTFSLIFSVEKIRENKKSLTITYKPVEGNSANAPKSDFIYFINTNFQNSELTLDFVSIETGVSQRKIANDIQNQFACNFKTYLNRLRINESKRLLLETDLNIGEIAFKVGFNIQSHFNRVFKSELQISPTEYRDRNKN